MYRRGMVGNEWTPAGSAFGIKVVWILMMTLVEEVVGMKKNSFF
jgi:hypothetical protein